MKAVEFVVHVRCLHCRHRSLLSNKEDREGPACRPPFARLIDAHPSFPAALVCRGTARGESFSIRDAKGQARLFRGRVGAANVNAATDAR